MCYLTEHYLSYQNRFSTLKSLSRGYTIKSHVIIVSHVYKYVPIVLGVKCGKTAVPTYNTPNNKEIFKQDFFKVMEVHALIMYSNFSLKKVPTNNMRLYGTNVI